MNVFDSGIEIVEAMAVFLSGLLICYPLARYFRVPRQTVALLYLWHTLFSLIYAWFVLTKGGDAATYFTNSLATNIDFALGTAAVVQLVSVFSVHLGLSFVGVSLIFNIIGSVGLLAFYGSLRLAVAGKSRLLRRGALLIVMLPSVSFWSSGIGKDPISFLAATLAIWAALDLRRRAVPMALAVLFMLYVRPHVASLMVLSLLVAFLVHSNVGALRRVALGLVTAAVATSVIPFALEKSGLGDETRVEGVISYIESRQAHNLHGGGAVDISSMSFPLQLGTYLFRPLPFEVDTVFQLAAAIDNVVLIALFLFAVHSMLKRRSSSVAAERVFLWCYALSAWVILATTTANLGISVRQKWMFVPAMIFLLLSICGRVRSKESSNETVSGNDRPAETLYGQDAGTRAIFDDSRSRP